MSAPLALCTFLVGGRRFGLPVGDVTEVLRRPELHRLPLAPPAVPGLVHLRGRILPAVDLRLCLGIAAAGRAEAAVVAAGDVPAALLVDEVEDVTEIGPGELEPLPIQAGHAGGSLDAVRSVASLPGGLAAVLDLSRVLARAFHSPEDERASRPKRGDHS